MTGSQETTLIICAACAAITVVVHLLVKNRVAAVLVALAMCVGGVAFAGWLERAESALWLVGTVIAGGLAAGVTLAISVGCIFVGLVRAAGRSEPRQPQKAGSSTGDGGKRL